MTNKNFLLLSLEDSKTKKIANVVSNDSCRKILEYLSNKEATETELAEKLMLPISTAHYNLQQLMETGLISTDEFHYSKKGKEVKHYKLANKYIIIAPKSTFGIKERLKGILPVVLIVSGAAVVIQLINRYISRGILQSAEKEVIVKSAIADKVAEAAPALSQSLPETTSKTASILPQNIASWFLAGALFALVVYFVLGLVRREFK